MNKLIFGGLALAVGLALTLAAIPVLAGTRVMQGAGEDEARKQASMHKLYDHPKTEAVSNGDVKIRVTTDRIMRSCCQPPDLVINGKITNASPRTVDFV